MTKRISAKRKKITIIFLYLITFWHPPNSIEEALLIVGKYATERNTTESNFVWSHSSVFSSHWHSPTSQLFLTTSLGKWFSMIIYAELLSLDSFNSYLLNHMTLLVLLPTLPLLYTVNSDNQFCCCHLLTTNHGPGTAQGKFNFASFNPYESPKR